MHSAERNGSFARTIDPRKMFRTGNSAIPLCAKRLHAAVLCTKIEDGARGPTRSSRRDVYCTLVRRATNFILFPPLPGSFAHGYNEDTSGCREINLRHSFFPLADRNCVELPTPGRRPFSGAGRVGDGHPNVEYFANCALTINL